MSDPHNYRKVGHSMILVSASLAIIAIIGLFIGEDVLFADNIQRAKTAEFDECKKIDFQDAKCEKYLDKLNNEIAGIYVGQEAPKP